MGDTNTLVLCNLAELGDSMRLCIHMALCADTNGTYSYEIEVLMLLILQRNYRIASCSDDHFLMLHDLTAPPCSVRMQTSPKFIERCFDRAPFTITEALFVG